MQRRIRILLLLLLGCGAGGSFAGPSRPAATRVLFIGNSLTAANDLPATVTSLAAASGDSMRTRSVSRPNLALIDHVNGLSDALDVIRDGRRVVRLQLQPVHRTCFVTNGPSASHCIR